MSSSATSWISTALTALLLLPVPASAEESSGSRADRFLRHIDDLWRGDSSFAKVTMRVKTRHYTRTLRMDAWSKGKERSLVRITSPLKEKGTVTLKSGNNIYTYLPRTDRTIRLTSGMMMGSWMGSHFTNDDLVNESRREEDYETEISFEGERDGAAIIEFTLVPKPDAAVVWGKVVLTVCSDNLIPLSERFFDEEMELARTFTFDEVKPMAGMPRPSVMRVVPADQPEEFTELIYEELELDIGVENSFFSLANLRRR